MHKWYSSVCHSASHSVVWATVAALEMAGIIPRSRQAYALPDTIMVVVVAGHSKEYIYSYAMYFQLIYAIYKIYILCTFNTYERYIL